MNDALRPDRDMLFAHWRQVVRDGEVYEVRIPDTRKRGPANLWGTQSGFFDNGEDFASTIGRITSKDALAVFMTVNPVNPDLLARRANRLDTVDKGDGAGDGDIPRLTRFFIDCDPVRISKVSATDGERTAALQRRDAVRAYLTDCGWPEPDQVAESGNGGHLIYRIDMPNEPDAVDLLRRCLDELGGLFDTATVKIDRTTFNPSRLVKIPGTIAAKGDSIPSRPHRMATATYFETVAVDLSLLDALAGRRDAPGAGQQKPGPSVYAVTAGAHRSWEIGDVLLDAGIGYATHNTAYGTVYALDRCLTSNDHTDGASITEMKSGALAYRCHHDRCSGKGWQVVRDRLPIPKRDPQPAVAQEPGGHGRQRSDPSAEWSFDLVALADVQPKAVDWVWPNWLAAGKLHILAGHPGDGKSTITAWLAAILSTGGTLPDEAQITPAGTLFLLGEDAVDDTLRPRLDLHGGDVSQIFAIRAVTDGKRRGVVNLASHLDLLRDQLRTGRYRLLVVDPLTAFMPRTDRNAEGDVRDVLTPLADLADETGVALLAVAHVGKAGKDAGRRVLQMILGATAFGAAARVVWMNAEIPDSEGRRLLTVIKSNIGPKPKGLEWTREIDGPVIWHGESEHDIEDVMQGGGPKALAVAADFLTRTLASGPMKQASIELMATREGIATRTLTRAKKGLGVVSERDGQSRNAPWRWRLPLDGQTEKAGHLDGDSGDSRLDCQKTYTESWQSNRNSLDGQTEEVGHLDEAAEAPAQSRLRELNAEPLPSERAGGEPGADRWSA